MDFVRRGGVSNGYISAPPTDPTQRGPHTGLRLGLLASRVQQVAGALRTEGQQQVLQQGWDQGQAQHQVPLVPGAQGRL